MRSQNSCAGARGGWRGVGGELPALKVHLESTAQKEGELSRPDQTIPPSPLQNAQEKQRRRLERRGQRGGDPRSHLTAGNARLRNKKRQTQEGQTILSCAWLRSRRGAEPRGCCWRGSPTRCSPGCPGFTSPELNIPVVSGSFGNTAPFSLFAPHAVDTVQLHPLHALLTPLSS